MADKNQSQAFEGRGKIYFTPVKNGVEGEPYWVGVVQQASIANSVENENILKEYHSGSDLDWDTSDGSVSNELTIELAERRDEAMKAALQATSETVETGSVVAEEQVVTKIGQLIFLKHQKVSAVTVVDGAAKALVEGTDYTIDEAYGLVEMLTDGHTSPLVFGYSYGEVKIMKPMTNDVDHYIVRLNGLNKVGQKGKQVITARKANLSVADALDLIADDFSKMTIKLQLLFDETAGAPYTIIDL